MTLKLSEHLQKLEKPRQDKINIWETASYSSGYGRDPSFVRAENFFQNSFFSRTNLMPVEFVIWKMSKVIIFHF